MKRWEILEDYLLTYPASDFTATSLANNLGIDTPEASLLIQSHLDAQRRPKAKTLYVLHRTGRTTASVWHIGDRSQDARSMGHVFTDDIRVRILRALEPDLARMGLTNARAIKVTNAIAAAVGGAIQLLEASLP